MKSNLRKINYNNMDGPMKPILRPRTAYNFFCKYQRDIILNEKLMISNDNSLTDVTDEFTCDALIGPRPQRKANGLICFKQMTKIVSKRWKEASPETRRYFKKVAEKDKVRYTRALARHKNSKQHDITMNFHSPQVFTQCSDHLQENGRNICYQDSSFLHASSKSIDSYSYHNVLDEMEKDSFDETLSKRNQMTDIYDFRDPLGIPWSIDELNMLRCFTNDILT